MNSGLNKNSPSYGQKFLCQVCEFAIDLVLDDAQVQKATFSHVIDGAARSNYLDGTEYDVNMSFQSKSQHQKKMVGIFK